MAQGGRAAVALLVAAGLVALVAGLGAWMAGGRAGPTVGTGTAAAGTAGKAAAGRICGDCHEPVAAAWAGSTHARYHVTCPICHGEGRGHVASGGRRPDGLRRPRKLPYEAGVYLCGRCHDLRQFRRSGHYQIKVLDCFSCHRAHAFAPSLGTVTFCGVRGCHPDIARGLQGHRTRLALASCATCHLPVTTDWRTRESSTNHTLRPALAREVLHRLTRGAAGPVFRAP